MKDKSGINNKSVFVLLTIIAFFLFVIDILTGDTYIPIRKIVSVFVGEETDMTIRNIVVSIRLTRAVSAMLVGAALAVSGLQMQTIFQNPLADPYLLGISSGASLGVALFILGMPILGVSANGVFQSIGLIGSAWIGSAVILMMITLLGRFIKNILGILIIGIMMSYFAGAIIQILQYVSSAEQLKLFTLWSMGSLNHITISKLSVMLPVIIFGLLLSLSSIKALNLLLMGEDYAQTMGLDLRRSGNVIFLSTCMLAGTSTAFCGPIGFIGLAIPHICRMLLNDSNHKIIMPASVLIGVIIMLVCDIIAKTIVLPINSITALIGIPVILWVIIKNVKL